MRNIYLERERMEMKMKKIKNGCSCLGPCFSLYHKKMSSPSRPRHHVLPIQFRICSTDLDPYPNPK